MRSLLIILLFLLFIPPLRAQSKLGLEQYSYMGAGQPGSFAPVAHFECSRKWYAEARYNYDEWQTFSFYMGKIFSGGHRFSYTVMPRVGILTGNYKGTAAGINVECNWKQYCFSSQSQYNLSTSTSCRNFFFSWSELYVQPVNWFFTGLSMQETRVNPSNSVLDAGVLLGFSIKHVRIPFYVFRPGSGNRYLVAGICWEWKHEKAIKSE